MIAGGAINPEVTGVSGQRQAAYEAERAAMRGQFEAMVAAGDFRAPFEPTHAPQGDLGLPEPLHADDSQAEAA